MTHFMGMTGDGLHTKKAQRTKRNQDGVVMSQPDGGDAVTPNQLKGYSYATGGGYSSHKMGKMKGLAARAKKQSMSKGKHEADKY